jgi:methyl-accepting chemotaxis protein
MTLTISKRLLIVIATALACTMFVGAFGVWQLSRAQHRFEVFQDDVTRSVNLLNSATPLLYKSRVQQYRFAMFSATGQREDLSRQIDDNVAEMASTFDKYAKEDLIGADERDRTLLAADQAALARFVDAQSQYLSLVKSGDLKGAYALQDDGALLRVASLAMEKNLADHIAYNVERGVRMRTENASAYRMSWWVLTSAIAAAALLCSVMGVKLQRGIKSSLASIRNVLESARQNLDLSKNAPVLRLDEIGHTASAFNELQQRVGGAMSLVRVSADAVATASRQIATGNADLSARTEEQAASLEETASSMTQLTETVRQNADNARQASALATGANELAAGGNNLVVSMLETMREISHSSDKISEITSVIDGIAFQTNILALNAAVEAARAGEQGRGFAVVAGEVRVLAQRSSAAAKEIKGLIDSSVTTVHLGTARAGEVGQTMGQVKQAISEVSDIVSEIAEASKEQGVGIEQINKAVSQMDEVTQQNAALVEQAAAAAQSLEQQAVALNESVSQFRLADTSIPS